MQFQIAVGYTLLQFSRIDVACPQARITEDDLHGLTDDHNDAENGNNQHQSGHASDHFTDKEHQ